MPVTIFDNPLIFFAYPFAFFLTSTISHESERTIILTTRTGTRTSTRQARGSARRIRRGTTGRVQWWASRRTRRWLQTWWLTRNVWWLCTWLWRWFCTHRWNWRRLYWDMISTPTYTACLCCNFPVWNCFSDEFTEIKSICFLTVHNRYNNIASVVPIKFPIFLILTLWWRWWRIMSWIICG